MKCAGCGREVEQQPNGQWAELFPSQGIASSAHNFVCDWMPGPEPGTVAWADYHYVEGEEQRHFVAEGVIR